ncbi:MAG: hypothetical protein KKB81_02325 [Candidatus Margulisbacteria bacterium]|nr:hypothetical protein [Candidatus Margulisiibacteriota bacterium]MBU1954420.1 hypothetical protein [Candidatus Margulisiibacteriota bacterium]
MNSILITPLVGSIFALALGLFVLSRKIRSAINQTFALFCFETFHWQFCWLISYFFTSPIAKDLIIRIAFSVIIFIPFTFYHFAILFLNLSPRKKQVWFAYGFGAFFLILLWTSNMYIAGYRDFWWGYYPKVGPLFSIYLIGVFFFMLRALILTFGAMKNEHNEINRNKIKYMVLALFMYFFATIEYAIDYGIPLYPIGAFFIIGAWSINAYAITKYRLMDISVVISRVTAEVLAVLTLGSMYLGSAWLYLAYISSKIDLGFLAWTILYGVFVGQTYQKIRLFIQTTSDKLFLKGKYEFRKEAASIAEKLAMVVNLNDLSETLEHIRLENLEVSSINILLPENFGGRNGREDIYSLWDLKKAVPKSNGIKLEKNNSLIQLILRDKSVFIRSEIPKVKAKDLEKLAFEVCVPCFSRGELIAVLLIGKKLSEDPYRDEELDVFRTLAPQFAIVIERIKPFEQITERYQKTKEVAQHAVQQAQYGALIQRIRHEFNNPLAMMLTRSELVLKNLTDSEAVKKFAEVVIRNIKRLMELTEAMQRVGSTNQGKEMTNVNINNILKDIILVGGATFEGKGINVIEDFGNIPGINASEAEINQLFMNLILNAADAMQNMKDRNLTLVSRPVKMQKTSGEVMEGAEIRVKDTGCGISQENLDKLFDPFFTTKVKGSGLGLSRSAEIVAEYDGTIEVETEVNKGTTFIVKFPKK